MAAVKDETVQNAFAQYLQPEEQLQHYAFGIKQPPILLIIALFCLAILPGIIATFLLTKSYFVGLTDRRVIILQVTNSWKVKEMREFPLNALPPGSTKTGGLFTHIKMECEPRFVAKFHRMGFKGNREHAMAIGARVSGTALPAA